MISPVVQVFVDSGDLYATARLPSKIIEAIYFLHSCYLLHTIVKFRKRIKKEHLLSAVTAATIQCRRQSDGLQKADSNTDILCGKLEGQAS